MASLPHYYQVFANPDILKEALICRAAFDLPGADGNDLYTKLAGLLIRQGEWDFEQEIAPYAVGMEWPQLGKESFPLEATAWLQEFVGPDNYLTMPRHASGKYKDHWNWIYFKDKSMAALFKLTWL